MESHWKTWRNWEDTYQCVADVCTANNLEELRLVIRKAKAGHKTIRVSGGGRGNDYSGSFSGSPVVVNGDNIIVRTPEMNLVWAHNDGTNRVTAQGGATLKELDVVVRQNRLSLATSTAPNFLTVAGAVALSCHGCGKLTGTLSDLVVGMTILTHDGELVTIGEHEHERLDAARVSLGALGIIVDVTFQCDPEFKLAATDTGKITVDEAVALAQRLHDEHDYLEYFWYPFNDKIWVKMWDRVPGQCADINAPGRFEDVKQRLIGAISTGLLRTSTNLPRLTPLVCDGLMAATPELTMVAGYPDVFHYQNYFPKRLYDLSYAIETGDDFGNFRSAFEFVRSKICQYAKPTRSCISISPFEYKLGAKFVQNFIVHCRFIKGSTGYMAPAVGFKSTCMFEAVTYIGTPSKEYYAEIEKHWQDLGGRPHWGKTYDPSQDFKKLYGHHWKKFNDIRKEMDPHGMFLNKFTRHVFHEQ